GATRVKFFATDRIGIPHRFTERYAIARIICTGGGIGMASYIGLNHALAQANSYAQIERILIRQWLTEYDRNTPGNDVVSVANGNFNYLFDIENERLIAAWGVSRGKHSGKRDSSRQAGSPLSAGKVYNNE